MGWILSSLILCPLLKPPALVPAAPSAAVKWPFQLQTAVKLLDILPVQDPQISSAATDSVSLYLEALAKQPDLQPYLKKMYDAHAWKAYDFSSSLSEYARGKLLGAYWNAFLSAASGKTFIASEYRRLNPLFFRPGTPEGEAQEVLSYRFLLSHITRENLISVYLLKFASCAPLQFTSDSSLQAAKIDLLGDLAELLTKYDASSVQKELSVLTTAFDFLTRPIDLQNMEPDSENPTSSLRIEQALMRTRIRFFLTSYRYPFLTDTVESLRTNYLNALPLPNPESAEVQSALAEGYRMLFLAGKTNLASSSQLLEQFDAAFPYGLNSALPAVQELRTQLIRAAVSASDAGEKAWAMSLLSRIPAPDAGNWTDEIQEDYAESFGSVLTAIASHPDASDQILNEWQQLVPFPFQINSVGFQKGRCKALTALFTPEVSSSSRHSELVSLAKQKLGEKIPIPDAQVQGESARAFGVIISAFSNYPEQIRTYIQDFHELFPEILAFDSTEVQTARSEVAGRLYLEYAEHPESGDTLENMFEGIFKKK